LDPLANYAKSVYIYLIERGYFQMFKIICLVLAVLALGLSKNSFTQTPEQQEALKYQTELYLASPDGRKATARMILNAQFPGWCDWSQTNMIVRSNGDIYLRCNGAIFGVDTTRRIAMRTIER
jgi:hypothetical protein